MFTLRKYIIDHYVLKNKVPKERLWLRMLGVGVLGCTLGFTHGQVTSESEDKTKFCVQFSGQEEQFYQLLDQTKKPIIKLYYTSGQTYLFKQRPSFLKAAKEYHNDVNFMMINCSVHYQHCRNIEFQRMPFVQAMLPQGSADGLDIETQMDGVYPVKTSNNDFTIEGVEGFLRSLNLIHPPGGKKRDFLQQLMKK